MGQITYTEFFFYLFRGLNMIWFVEVPGQDGW